jgi:phospholipid-transporting ATPase
MSEACESNLIVIACTGVEDELQEDVASCITDFRNAGIKFWVLTGDLGHTAKEIGYNCGVLSRDMKVNDIYNVESTDGETLANLI